MWEKDRLGRKKFADFLCTLIKNSDKYKRSEEENAYVIALDSPWGTGKTWFLDMFEKYLKENEEDHGIRVIHYSAWANDFWDNAFLPLLHALYKQDMLKLDAAEEKGKNGIKNVLKLAVYLGKEVGLKKAENVFGEEAAEMFRGGIESLEEHPEQGIEAVFQDYEDFCRAYETVRDMLSDYLERLGPNGKIVIVVDELDRCRPDFAVQTLEVVKHLFNADGLVFLFAVDMKQLGSVIRGSYGESLDAVNYLNRMFHYTTHLPEPDYGKYVRMLHEEKMSNFNSEHQRAEYSSILSSYVGKLAVGLQLSLRELDTIWKNYLILYDYKLKEYESTDAHLLYLTFLILKYKIPDLREYLDKNEYTALEEVPGLEGGKELLPADAPFRRMFEVNPRHALREINGWLYYEHRNGTEIIHSRIKKVEPDFLYWEENRAIKKEAFVCFSGILYASDIELWDRIKEWSLLEYMKEQLELFTFGEE